MGAVQDCIKLYSNYEYLLLIFRQKYLLHHTILLKRSGQEKEACLSFQWLLDGPQPLKPAL